MLHFLCPEDLVDEGHALAPPIDEGSTQAPPVDEGCARVPLIDEGHARALPINEGHARALPVDEGCAQAPLIYEGCTRAPPTRAQLGCAGHCLQQHRLPANAAKKQQEWLSCKWRINVKGNLRLCHFGNTSTVNQLHSSTSCPSPT